MVVVRGKEGMKTLSILCELWKTPLERKPNSGNRDTKLGRSIKDGNNKGRSKNSNGKNKKNNEKAI